MNELTQISIEQCFGIVMLVFAVAGLFFIVFIRTFERCFYVFRKKRNCIMCKHCHYHQFDPGYLIECDIRKYNMWGRHEGDSIAQDAETCPDYKTRFPWRLLRPINHKL